MQLIKHKSENYRPDCGSENIHVLEWLFLKKKKKKLPIRFRESQIEESQIKDTLSHLGKFMAIAILERVKVNGQKNKGGKHLN